MSWRACAPSATSRSTSCPAAATLDRWSRRDGVWAIDHRTFVDDLTAMYTPLLDGGPAPEVVVADPQYARRDRDDPSYGHLAG